MSVFAMTRLRGTSLGARAARSSIWTTGAFASSQLIRLGSNLILTRLLFPEAFGLMALVAVIIQGLTNFSDTGVMQAVMSHKRGEEPRFLNTAFTIQVVRGLLLWAFACLIAWPLSVFYDAPQLIQILPVAALSLVVMGVNPMRVATAHRHLLLGRVSMLDIISQSLGVVIAIALAWWMQSVWALVISGVLASVIGVAFNWLYLPGHPDRLQWDRAAARELTSFGKWIFLSTIAGFFVSQGDRILIGRFLTLGAFGVYNIGYFLASFPNMLGRMVAGKVLIPIYREAPPGESRANFLKLRRMRMVVTAILLTIIAVMGLAGLWLVGILYDDRYQEAGPVIVLLAVMWIPQIIALTYDQSALAVGDSRNFFILVLFRATALLTCVYVGLQTAGLLGAILGQGMAGLLSYPVTVWLSRKSGAWDPLHDALFAALGLLVAAVLFTVHRGAIVALAAGVM
ncbi:oligosaccharide flippase family protein [Roseivivax sp. CAU 1753]